MEVLTHFYHIFSHLAITKANAGDIPNLFIKGLRIWTPKSTRSETYNAPQKRNPSVTFWIKEEKKI